MKRHTARSVAFATMASFVSLGCGGDGTDVEWRPGLVINGTCAAPGESFTAVYSCETVEGPSPKEPPGSAAMVSHDPATLVDPDYGWVVQQLAACSCVCCHTDGASGSYKWSSNFGPAWSDSASDDVLDDLANNGRGSDVPPDQNHGFSRDESGVPTTDAARFKAFVARELSRRAN